MNPEKIWTIIDLIRWGQQFFNEKGISSPRLNIELMLSKILQCSRIDLYINFERSLNESQLSILRNYVKRRSKHEPLQYIFNESEFMGMKFKCDSRALIPRPETEILVREAINFLHTIKKTSPRILEVGTGSGVISLCIAHAFPKAQIYATDLSQDAIDLATENANLINIQNVVFFKNDFLTEEIEESEFDLIISNPPYIPFAFFNKLSKDILEFEPRISLTDGKEGLSFYDKFSKILDKLTVAGLMILEIDGRNTNDVITFFSNNLYERSIIKDFANIDRILKIIRL